jgi:hypothetical protein
MNSLKFIQILYRLYYAIKPIKKISWLKLYPEKLNVLTLQEGIFLYSSYFGNNTFSFLNKAYTFKEKIDWNYTGHGKLWAYNLNYFEFLCQKNINNEMGLYLIKDYIDQCKNIRIGYDSYPISLRNVFWIKFVSKYAIRDERIDTFLYATYKFLLHNLEYHLLGNHLLENAFSLLWGAFYFCDEKLYHKAVILLKDELVEQIVSDGAHFELSPMYHQIILYRLLDSINLLQNNQRFTEQKQLFSFLKEKAILMLQWLNTITFTSGEIPLFNDASLGIAPTTSQLNEYASNLKVLTKESFADLQANPQIFSQSGYRCAKNTVYECIVDIGQIGPSYQPGHAHADTFNFVLNAYNKPLVVDTGISTYDPGKIRLYERGTVAHNTVTVHEKNSSEVWSSFRVARRANVKLIEDNIHRIIAQHDGYCLIGTIHQRQWDFLDKQIVITDTLSGNSIDGRAFLHLAPLYKPEKYDSLIKLGNITITFDNASNIEIEQTRTPNGYNQFQDNYTIKISFKKHLTTLILLA